MSEFLGKEAVPIMGWTAGVPVEDSALQQLKNLASLPFIHKHIAVMPDVHWGCGSTVGSVFATSGAIIPAAVGVDIGCGMMAVRLDLKAEDLPDNLHAIRSAIEAAVPHGRTDNGGINDVGAWGDSFGYSSEVAATMLADLADITDKHQKLERSAVRAPHHVGTLGTGNHFIELCLDEENYVWIMLHSGSRGIGNAIGTYFINLAKKEMERFFINLPDKDLAYLPEGTEHFGEYLQAVNWAQKFARLNREVMMANVMKAVEKEIGRAVVGNEVAVNCHHNYVNKEKHFGRDIWLTRKGAVSAKQGELGIIPGSMGAKSFIVRGKGNRDSFMSCSHGAGRKHGRNEAKKLFTLDDHIKATEGVECRKDAEVIDETPMAYKDIDAVIAAQADLIEVVHTLKQVVCVKG